MGHISSEKWSLEKYSLCLSFNIVVRLITLPNAPSEGGQREHILSLQQGKLPKPKEESLSRENRNTTMIKYCVVSDLILLFGSRRRWVQ